MTEKELKKLNRYQLLELLVMQTTKADELEIQNEELKKKNEELQSLLNEKGNVFEFKNIEGLEIGSADDTLQMISGLLIAAKNTAAVYLKDAKKKADEIERNAQENADQILKNALLEAEKVLWDIHKSEEQA